jgi:hypothetical protein
MASHDSSKPRRLRIPKALAVALLGSSATIAVSFAGCDTPKAKVSVDAASETPDTGIVPDGNEQNAFADASIDGKPDAAIDAPPDVAIDAAIDARPDAAPDARPDAAPDARPDAAPDAPVA